jgi:predicted regulator of amino acid metabolism with ACT domain
MWPNVKKQFSRQVVRSGIVKKMIENGIRVGTDDKLYVGDIEVDYTAVAKAVGVDRRVVKQTVKQIRENPFLNGIFPNIAPFGSSLVNVVSKLGYSAIVIESDPKQAGVMAAVAAILAKHDLVIRQALAEDPDMVPDAKMTLVVEGSIGKAIQELNQLDMVKSIKIIK